MADGKKIDLLRAAQPIAGHLNGGWQVRNLVGAVCLVDQRLFVWAFRFQARSGADTVDLTFDETVKFAAGATGGEDLEFEARRSGVDDEDRVHGSYTAVTVV